MLVYSVVLQLGIMVLLILRIAKNWYEHNAEKVTEHVKAKILWDFNIQTDHLIQARRPDIVVKDKEFDHTTWIIDIAVPGDARVEDKEKE